MFLSARRIFNQQKNKRYEKVPAELLAALNKPISNNFAYHSLGEENQIAILEKIIKNNKPITATLKVSKIKDMPQEINGLTLKDIYQYAYNTQQKIKIEFDGDIPEIIDKGKRLPIACSIYNGKPLNMSNCEMIITPPPFQERKVLIQVDDVVEEINIIQEKSKDYYIYNYQGKGKYISFRFSFDTKKNKMKASSSIDFKEKVCIKDIIKTLKIYRGFCNRKIKIDGHELITAVPDIEICKMNEKVSVLNHDISWWEEIKKLEDIFHQEICLSIPLSKEQMILFDKLYIGLILKEAYQEENELGDIINITLLKRIDSDIIGKVLAFSIIQTQNLSNVDIHSNVYEVIYLCNVEIEKYDIIDTKKNKYRLKVKRNDIDKPYIVYRYFLTEEEAKKNLNHFPENPKPLREFKIIKS